MGNNRDDEKEKLAFLKKLSTFHQIKGTPYKQIYKINGKEVDLYLLYKTVTNLGGWEKVNASDQWGIVEIEMNLPGGCLNSSVALKHIYLRYLDEYEKEYYLTRFKFFNDSYSQNKKDEKDLFKSLNPVPSRYNQEQHKVNDWMRKNFGLSNEIFIPSGYEKLALSLISPLSNEQNFAVNSCYFLSVEGRFIISEEPNVFYYLMCHSGVYKEQTLAVLFDIYYRENRGHSLDTFWKDMFDYTNWSSCLETFVFLCQNSQFYQETGVQIYDDFALSRIRFIGIIITKFSFVLENKIFMAQDKTCLKFIVMLITSKEKQLHELGWDILKNVSSFIPPELCFIEPIIKICVKTIQNTNILNIISALYVFKNIIESPDNLKIFWEYFEPEILENIFSLLKGDDPVVISRTLDFLYLITQNYGEKCCKLILKIDSSLQILISLLYFKYVNGKCLWENVKFEEHIQEIGDINVVSYGSSKNSENEKNYENILMELERDNIDPFQTNLMNPVSFFSPFMLKENIENQQENSPMETSEDNVNTNTTTNNNNPNSVPTCDLSEFSENENTQSSSSSEGSIEAANEIEYENRSRIVHPIQLTPLLVNGNVYLTNSVIIQNKLYILGGPIKSNSPPETDKSPKEDSRISNKKFQMPLCAPSCTDSSHHAKILKEVDLLPHHSSPGHQFTDLCKRKNLTDLDNPGVPSKTEGQKFICEWRGCVRNFKSLNALYFHVCRMHCCHDKQKCLWWRCRDTERNNLSLKSHVYVKHCHPNIKRNKKSNSSLSKSQFTVFKGITKTFSDFVNAHEKTCRDYLKATSGGNEDKDHMTTSIQLSSALVIRNIITHCHSGRGKLRIYEQNFIHLLCSNSQLTFAMSDILTLINP